MAKVHKVTPEEINDLIAKGMTREEAEFALIDKYDEVVFPDETDDINDKLKEQKKIAHVYDKKKGPRKVERKPNDTKRAIIAELEKAFGSYENFAIVNKEREISFDLNGKNYSITITEHRAKK